MDLLIEKHDALRMVLLDQRDEEGVPLQAFAATLPVWVAPLDLQGQADPRQAAASWMQRQLERAFKLDGGPLFRFHLLKLEAQRFYFVVHAHHIVLDGWGIDGLCASLSQIYNALHDQRMPDLSAPSYVDFIEDDRDYRQSPRFARDQAYWLEKYRDLPEPLLLPRYRQTQAEGPSRSGHFNYSFSRDLENRIDDLAGRLQASRFHVLLAALYVYFTRTHQRDELVIGLPILNRSNASFKKTLGCLPSSACCACVSATIYRLPSWCRALPGGQAGLPQPAFPGQRSQPLAGVAPHRAHATVRPDVLLRTAPPSVAFRAANARSVKCSNNHEQTPLAIHLRTNAYDDEARLHYIYNEAYFQAEQIEPMAERLQHVLDQGLADEQLAVRAFALTTALKTSSCRRGMPASSSLSRTAPSISSSKPVPRSGRRPWR
ncbi:condensation domain-containing protein [Pseudomonas sp. PCH446]